jgi:archaellum component FlaC
MFWREALAYRLSARDVAALDEMAEAIKQRLQGFDSEIESLKNRCAVLEAEVSRLSAKQHQPLNAKLREKGLR